ncbi:SIR2 family NAD-dependent protein deacylase [Streptomyces tritici]|uniref:SIR2 family NAD-dependent protein deacylase n=1 Tax=Streptomyces tritici TaxID=2054410 RepID=UPI003AF0A289
MNSSDIEPPPYGFIAKELVDGRAVPFLGAAASYAGVPDDAPRRLPGGQGLAERLIDLWKGYPGTASDPLTQVTQYYEECVASHTDLCRCFRQVFYEEQLEQTPPPTARLLAAIEPPAARPFVIITTNYDCLVEKALDEAGRPYAVVIQDSNPGSPHNLRVRERESQGFKGVQSQDLVLDDYAGATLIYKLHGGFADGLDEDVDTLVVTEGDYIRFVASLASNTVPPSAIATHLLNDRRMLFLGYSMADWNMRVILYQLAQRRPNPKDVLRSWGVRRNVSVVEKRFWDKRDVELFDMDLAEFVAQLDEAIGAAA